MMPFFFDPFMILLIPPILLAYYANSKVKSTFEQYSERLAESGVTGAEAASRLLEREGLNDVRIESTEGKLSDHYDPRSKVLRLSRPVYGSNSLAALGIAAHETGHALQDSGGYLPLKLRSGIYPVAAFGNKTGPVLFMIGLMMMIFTGATEGMAQILAQLGILLFAGGTVFTLITLPVEFNASRRAMALLTENGIISARERDDTKKVLNAAALTYVAAALMMVMMLARYILLFMSLRRR